LPCGLDTAPSLRFRAYSTSDLHKSSTLEVPINNFSLSRY
jgi:hypothetical protein